MCGVIGSDARYKRLSHPKDVFEITDLKSQRFMESDYRQLPPSTYIIMVTSRRAAALTGDVLIIKSECRCVGCQKELTDDIPIIS